MEITLGPDGIYTLFGGIVPLRRTKRFELALLQLALVGFCYARWGECVRLSFPGMHGNRGQDVQSAIIFFPSDTDKN